MTSTQTAKTFKLEATAGFVKATMTVETPELAREIAATFPKSAKVRGGAITSYPGPTTVLVQGFITFKANIAADGVNGGRNETGIKRYHAFRRQATKLGYDATYTTPYTNSFTEAEFDAAVTA